MREELDFQEIGESVDLFDLAPRYTQLNHSGNGPCPLCGGKDRFFVTREGRTFGCRKCGWAGDALDFIAGVERVTLVEAARILSGKGRILPAPVVRQPDRKRESLWRDAAWQRRANKLVTEAFDQLRNPLLNIRAMDYLASRGIWEGIAMTYRLGFIPDRFDPIDKTYRPAIVVPWMAPDGRITAVKFRFIDKLAKADKGRRFIQLGGSESILFGLQSLNPTPGILVGIEGEFNALAVRQALPPEAFDVVSFGAEANTLGLQALAKMSGTYSGTAVWLDSAEKMANALAHLPPATIPIVTPVMGRRAVAMDANDLLKHRFFREGGLGTYILGKLEAEG